MKKKLVLTVLMLSAIMCFAETKVIAGEEDSSLFDYDKGGLYIDLGSPIYETSRLIANHDSLKNNSGKYLTKGFAVEIGYLESDEDGLFDIIQKGGVGFQIGSLANGKDFAWSKDSKVFCSSSDAVFNNVYIKDVGGIQINLFFLSVGGMLGPKLGFEWMHMNTTYSPLFNREKQFRENRLYLDLALQPYISINLLGFIKISFSAEFDLPVFRARFTKEPDVGEYVFNWDWFKNDIPITYFAGVAFIF